MATPQKDPKSLFPYLEALSRVQSRGIAPLFQDWLARRTPEQRKLLLGILIGLGALLVYSAVVGVHHAVVELWRFPQWGSRAFGLGMLLVQFGAPLAIYAFVLVYVLRFLLAWQRFAEFTLVAAPSAVRLGEEVEGALRLVPRKDFELERLVMKLVGTEIARETTTTGTGSDRRTTTYTHTYERVAGEQVVRQGLPLSAEVPKEYRARFRVPKWMHSFQEGSCEFRWRLVAEACSRAFPDLSRECDVTVLAEEASGSDG